MVYPSWRPWPCWLFRLGGRSCKTRRKTTLRVCPAPQGPALGAFYLAWLAPSRPALGMEGERGTCSLLRLFAPRYCLAASAGCGRRFAESLALSLPSADAQQRTRKPRFILLGDHSPVGFFQVGGRSCKTRRWTTLRVCPAAQSPALGEGFFVWFAPSRSALGMGVGVGAGWLSSLLGSFRALPLGRGGGPKGGFFRNLYQSP